MFTRLRSWIEWRVAVRRLMKPIKLRCAIECEISQMNYLNGEYVRLTKELNRIDEIIKECEEKIKNYEQR